MNHTPEAREPDEIAKSLKIYLSKRFIDAMKVKGMTISDLAREMQTSRSQVHRILDPWNTSISLNTICDGARALNLEMPLPINTHKPKVTRATVKASSAPATTPDSRKIQ